jgi:hypothetical protein
MLWRDPNNESAARGLRQAEKGIALLEMMNGGEEMGGLAAPIGDEAKIDWASFE